MSEKIPKDKIEQIIEQKVQKRVKEELKKRGIKQNEKNNTKRKESVSRRKFMKSIGAGALGAAGLAMTSKTAALDLSENTVSTTANQITMENGDVEIPDGHLNLANSNNIQDAGTNAINFDGNQNVEIPNGNLQLSQNITADGNSITFGNDITLNPDNNINLNDGNNNTLLTINQSGPVQIQDTDLRLDTGQSIEDGGGQQRVGFTNSATNIYAEGGTRGIVVNEYRNGVMLRKSGNGTLLRDDDGGFDAVTYMTSSSAPGTLEMSNAKLQLYRTSSDPDASQGEMWYRSDLD